MEYFHVNTVTVEMTERKHAKQKKNLRNVVYFCSTCYKTIESHHGDRYHEYMCLHIQSIEVK